jgi:cell division protein FtsI/penicillin-binding protein 2
MLIAAARHGEAQWIYKDSDLVAGKTGTAEIPDLTHGGYLTDQTLASFIGFAPARQPEFVMLVKLTAPQSSPWAAETAAPLWNKIAAKLFVLLGVDVSAYPAQKTPI